MNPYLNDIAFVHLPAATAAILNSPYISLIDLPIDPNTNTDNLLGTLTGYAAEEPDYNYNLRFIQATIMSNSWCMLNNQDREHDWTTKMCMDTTTVVSPCIEGNGGPLTANVGGRSMVVGIGAIWTTW